MDRHWAFPEEMEETQLDSSVDKRARSWEDWGFGEEGGGGGDEGSEEFEFVRLRDSCAPPPSARYSRGFGTGDWLEGEVGCWDGGWEEAGVEEGRGNAEYFNSWKKPLELSSTFFMLWLESYQDVRFWPHPTPLTPHLNNSNSLSLSPFIYVPIF